MNNPDNEVEQSLTKRNKNSFLTKIKVKIQWKLILAFLCILGDIACWITRAETIQEVEESYDKPMFVSYIVHFSYLVFIIIWIVFYYILGNWKFKKFKEGSFSWKYSIFISFVFTLIIFCYNYTWYLSLPRTEVAANTAIYESAPAFVFIFSIPILGESVNLSKVFSLLISLVGVTLITVFQTNQPSTNNTTLINVTTNISNSTSPSVSENSPSPLGYILVIVSTILYSLYEVLYKRFATKKDDTAPIMNTIRLLGLIGIWYIIIVAPFIVIAHFTGLERFELPSINVALVILLSSTLDAISNILILLGIILSSPLFVSMGALLALPSSALADFLVHGEVMNTWSMIGAMLIILGFIGFIFTSYIYSLSSSKRDVQVKSRWFSVKEGWNIKDYTLYYLIGWYPTIENHSEEEPLLNAASISVN